MTATPSRVFVARLAGIAVFDPAGDQIGRVRDVVVVLRPQPRPPRVLGLVVEVPPHRRVFLPITRVTNIDVGAVIFDGRINMRRFEKRGSETLALGEMLDRRVELVEGEHVVVIDLAMEQSRSRDWLITKVAVRRTARDRPGTVTGGRPAAVAPGRGWVCAGGVVRRSWSTGPRSADSACPTRGRVRRA